MAKIRNLKIRDISKLRKMISMVSDTDDESVSFGPFGFNLLIPFPFNFINNILPIRFRSLQESFVSLEEDRQINGMIALKAQYGNPFSWNISKLFLNKNSYAAGRQLVGFATAKYGAMGANTFTVRVDCELDELMELFSKGCGFRMCSTEQLWKMEKISTAKSCLDKGFFRPFKNSDAEAVQNIYNDNIFSHFRYSLAKTKKEFHNIVFSGLSKTSYFKYVVEEGSKIKGYFSIQTDDNKNFILDVELVQGYDECYGDVINFAISRILARKKNFSLYVINKKYQVSGAKIEDYLSKNNFKCIKSQIVMVKDYYKKIQEEQRSQKPAIVFNDISRKPAFKVINKEENISAV